jgi:prolyl 4-hydroxylase
LGPCLLTTKIPFEEPNMDQVQYHYHSGHIFAVSGLFSAAECQEFIRRAEGVGFGDAPINSAFGQVVAKEIRNNTRVMIDDSDLAAHVWERTRDFIPAEVAGTAAIGLNERFRFYRYDPGEIFRWHRDGYFERENGERSRLTFMIYLNDDFTGGQTKFEGLDVQPEQGKVLVFHHGLLHEGGEVRSGRKYVLRSDVMFAAARPRG